MANTLAYYDYDTKLITVVSLPLKWSLMGAALGKAPVVITNMTLRWEWLTVTNTLAYYDYDTKLITVVSLPLKWSLAKQHSGRLWPRLQI